MTTPTHRTGPGFTPKPVRHLRPTPFTLALALAFTLLAMAAPARAQTPTPATDPLPIQASGTTPSDAKPGEPKSSRGKSNHEKTVELIGLSIGAFATVMGIGIAWLAIWSDYRKRKDLLAACHAERLAALERGLEVPPFPAEFHTSDTNACDGPRDNGLKSGLLWLAAGIGLWLFLSPNNKGFFHPSVGAIPGAIGVAYLIYFLLEGRRLADDRATRP